ncbi:hypothetical protein NDU88_006708 [Pleurodeles waltl]|uniref:Uncharacterized protein n=1 Tax=Pleurodeles waltl TaxID=8319 RepID=A0AAV7MGQ7_PLEWA|nr:hypothetical protein NDU88_006708 [Pleurodeles waltl]
MPLHLRSFRPNKDSKTLMAGVLCGSTALTSGVHIRTGEGQEAVHRRIGSRIRAWPATREDQGPPEQ